MPSVTVLMFIYHVHVHMGLMRTYVFGYCSHVHILCSCSYGVTEDIYYVHVHMSSVTVLMFIWGY